MKAVLHLVWMLSVLVVVTTSALPAANQPKRSPVFAAVSIGRVGARPARTLSNPTFYAPRVSLRQLVETAYVVTRARTAGGPDWMDELLWVVAAKAPDPAPPYSAVRAMLKNLLSDRFGLKATSAPTPTSTIVLSFPETGQPSRLRASRARVNCRPFLSGQQSPTKGPTDAQGFPLCGPSRVEGAFVRPLLHLRSAPLDAFAREMEIMLHQPVVVVPHREGLFDIDFECPAGYLTTDDDPDVDAFLSAMEQQLGAKGQIRTMPVDVLTIQSAVRPTLGTR